MSVSVSVRGERIVVTGVLVTEECYECHMIFALPERLKSHLIRNAGTSFYCPLGHQQHYLGKSHDQQLQEAREATARERARHDQTKAEVQHQKRRVASAKGHLTRTKNRIAAGVCPCCNRSFQDLARHMKGQHPEYGGGE